MGNNGDRFEKEWKFLKLPGAADRLDIRPTTLFVHLAQERIKTLLKGVFDLRGVIEALKAYDKGGHMPVQNKIFHISAPY